MKVYTAERPRPSRARTRVGIADSAIADGGGTISTSGLGSCVGVCLFDADAGVAGLVHAMLPEADDDPTAKYVDTGTRLLFDELLAAGGDRRRVEAKLAGGSTMFEFSSAELSIGDRNVAAARAALAALDVPIVAEDVGGEHGRSLELRADSGELRIRSAARGDRTI